MSNDEVELCLRPIENGTRASWKLDDLAYQLETVEQTFKQFGAEHKEVEHLIVEYDSCIDGKITEYYKLLPDLVKSLASGGMNVKKATFLGLPPHGIMLKELGIKELELNDGGLFGDKDFFEFLTEDHFDMERAFFGNLDGPALATAVSKLQVTDITIELLQEKSKHGTVVLKAVMDCACHTQSGHYKVKVSVNMGRSQKFEEVLAAINHAVIYDAPNYPEEVTVKYFVVTKHQVQSQGSGSVTITRASYANYDDEDEKWSSLDLVCQTLKRKEEAEDFLRGIGYDGEQEVKEKILKGHF